MAARVTHSRTQYLSGAPHVIVWTGADGMRKVDLGPHLLSVSVNKSTTETTGNFTLDILPIDRSGSGEVSIRGDAERVSEYVAAIEPNSPVSIGVDTPGGIMLGLVDSCDYSSYALNDQVRVGVKITGTDMGYILDDKIISAGLTTGNIDKWKTNVASVLGEDAPILKELMGAEGPVNAAGERSLINMPVDKVAEYTIQRVQGFQSPILKREFGGKGAIGDFCEIRVIGMEGDLVYKPGLYQQENSIGGFLSEIIDQDFYEIRMESVPRKGMFPQTVLIIRPKPFDEEEFKKAAWPTFRTSDASSWDKLQTLVDGLSAHELSSDDVVGNLQLGRTRREAINFYTVQNNNELGITADNAGSGETYPIYDLDSATRYISKRYDSRCSLVPADPSDKATSSTIAASIEQKRNRLFCWNRANPWFMNGSATVRGKDSYRAGDPVWIPWLRDPLSGEKGVRFYATAVSHSWRYGGNYTCNLSLARGHGPGFWEEFLKRVAVRMPSSLPYGWASADR